MSYTATFTLAPTNATNTTFQAWASKLSDVLTNSGLILANTSPIDIHSGSLAVAGANNTPVISQVWRFADALQNTEPIFFKIEYGSGDGLSLPAVWLTIGSGQTGNTVTGNTSTRTKFSTLASNTNLMSCFVSGDVNRFALSFFVGPAANGASANTGLLLGVERALDANGSPTADAVLVVGYSANSGFKQVAWNHLGNFTAFETSLGLNMPATTTSKRITPTIALGAYPIYHTKTGSFFNSGLNWIGYFAGDLFDFQSYAVTHYSAIHHYITLSDDALPNAAITPTTGASLMMRYE